MAEPEWAIKGGNSDELAYDVTSGGARLEHCRFSVGGSRRSSGEVAYALPAMADAVGWTYRKGWFAKPELRAEFKQKYNRELEPPKTWDELLEVSKFFTGKEIDGKKVYGTYIYTERGSEGITMGVTNAM